MCWDCVAPFNCCEEVNIWLHSSKVNLKSCMDTPASPVTPATQVLTLTYYCTVGCSYIMHPPQQANLQHCIIALCCLDLPRSLPDVCMHLYVFYACSTMFPAMSPACVEPACVECRRQEKLKRPRRTFDKPVNEGLERFKFWLGLPNQYYQDDWHSRSE